MDALMQVHDLLTVQLRLDGGERAPTTCLGCLVAPDRVLTVAYLFGDAERQATRIEARISISLRQGKPGESPRTITRNASSALVDRERGVAMIPLDASADVPAPWTSLIATEDATASDACTIVVLRPRGGVNLRPDSTAETMPTRIVARVEGPATVAGVVVQQLRIEGQDTQPGDGGAPVFVGDRLVGLLFAGDEEGARYMIPTSSLARAVAAFDMDASAEAGSKEFVPKYAQTVMPNAPPTRTEDATRGAPFDPVAIWPRLSTSSRRAFRHAESLRRRDGKTEVHMEHLLLGLYEKREGPTRAELQRAGIDDRTLRERLDSIAERKLPPYERSEDLPALEAMPQLSSHVREALQAAVKVADAHAAPQVQSRHLLFGALSVRKCGMIEWMFQRENPIDPGRIDMSAPPSPARDPEASPVETDAASSGRSASGTLPRRGRARVTPDLAQGDDLLDVQREVEAIAAVVAARDTSPPLSIGLFGDWGTGKSFFMTRMEREVNDLRELARAHGTTAYCSNIVQLRFNAWHYMDTDLWASLAAEIFEGLASALALDDALLKGTERPAEARARLLVATSHLRDLRAQAEQRKVEAAAALKQSELQLALLENEQRAIEVRLTPRQIARSAARFLAAQPESKASLDRAARAIGIPDAETLGQEARTRLLELRGLWGGARAIWMALSRGSARLWILLALSVFFTVALASLVIAFRFELRSIAAQAAALLTAALGFATPVIARAKRAIAIVEQARTENSAIIEQAKRDREEELKRTGDAVRQRVAAEEESVRRVNGELAELERELDALRADRQMSNFVTTRRDSTDYTRHFGVIARARHDFERLTTLLKRVAEEARPEDRVPRIDRIVLYIDDLDRCPEDKVVDVLQAVHLLLAFPLFIVVVGVDSRWLLHSLRRNASAFRPEDADDGIDDDEEVSWQSTPFNYLEKIFQIPFHLRPMDEAGYAQLIGVLTAPSQPAPHVPLTQAPAASSTPPTTQPVGDTPRVSAPPAPDVAMPVAAESPAATEARDGAPVAAAATGTAAPAAQPAQPAAGLAPRSSGSIGPVRPAAKGSATAGRIDPNPPFLDLADEERAFMQRMHALIPTPRAAKRYVNVYRLLRALVSDERRQRLDADGGGRCRHVLLLLAILTGFPQEGTVILRELLRRDPEGSWWEFVDALADENMRVLEADPTADADASRDATATVVASRVEARQRAQRWLDLHLRLQRVREHVTHELGAQPSCRDFREWARPVARYSFEAGRVLQA